MQPVLELSIGGEQMCAYRVHYNDPFYVSYCNDLYGYAVYFNKNTSKTTLLQSSIFSRV